jgi:hypothetical protein
MCHINIHAVAISRQMMSLSSQRDVVKANSVVGMLYGYNIKKYEH